MVKMAMSIRLSDHTLLTVSELAKKYLWWQTVGDEPHSIERIIAQIMNLGTYEDIRRLESLLDRADMIAAMQHAQPGWFSARSWEFWRGRLSAAPDLVATEPPKRSFARAG